jgi:hypothetical protein
MLEGCSSQEIELEHILEFFDEGIVVEYIEEADDPGNPLNTIGSVNFCCNLTDKDQPTSVTFKSLPPFPSTAIYPLYYLLFFPAEHNISTNLLANTHVMQEIFLETVTIPIPYNTNFMALNVSHSMEQQHPLHMFKSLLLLSPSLSEAVKPIAMLPHSPTEDSIPFKACQRGC